MNRKLYIPILLLGLLLVSGTAFAGPYAPAAGQPGSGAIHMDDTRFVAWATGWQDLVYGTEVDDTWKTPEKALGKARKAYEGDGFHSQGELGFSPYLRRVYPEFNDLLTPREPRDFRSLVAGLYLPMVLALRES